MDMTDPRGPHVVEMFGDHIVGCYMGGWDESEVAVDDLDSTDKRHSLLTLDDGTVFGSVSTSFLDTLLGHIVVGRAHAGPLATQRGRNAQPGQKRSRAQGP